MIECLVIWVLIMAAVGLFERLSKRFPQWVERQIRRIER